jgi:hypothetical protein
MAAMDTGFLSFWLAGMPGVIAVSCRTHWPISAPMRWNAQEGPIFRTGSLHRAANEGQACL